MKAGKGDGGRGPSVADPGDLFEQAGPLIARLRAEGPFPSAQAMIARAAQILDSLSEAEQLAVINAHPQIGEKAETVRAQSTISFREQGYEHDVTPPEVFRRLAALNEEYEQKFGFRFVVFVNRRPKEALIPVLEARLRSTRAEERATALREILAIARDRCSRSSS